MTPLWGVAVLRPQLQTGQHHRVGLGLGHRGDRQCAAEDVIGHGGGPGGSQGKVEVTDS